MSTSRRDFIRTAAAASGALAVGILPDVANAAPREAGERAPRQQRIAPKKILILGGTSFIGPRQVEYALERGHTITLFNRGRTNPQLFPTVEKLIGDRATFYCILFRHQHWQLIRKADVVRGRLSMIRQRVRRNLDADLL